MNLLIAYTALILLMWALFASMFSIALNFFSFEYIDMRFLWYDFWIGIYYDRRKRVVYINPLPCVVISYLRIQ